MTEAPFFAGRIEGVRGWNISDDLELHGRGMGSSEPWAAAGSPTEASCLYHDHAAPDVDCGCGLYALHPQTEILEWAGSLTPGGVAGVVEAWGRIELHEVGFRAQFSRPKLLFEPAPHLISTEGLAMIRATAERYRIPVVRLPRAEHASEWCRVRQIGLSTEVVDEMLLKEVRLILRRTSRVSLDRRWLRVGVWPEVVDGSEVRPRIDELPGVQVCTVRVRGPEAIAAFESEEFDPGNELRLVRKATWDYEGVDVCSQAGRRLGPLAWPIAREIGPRIAAGRVREVRCLSRNIGLRAPVKGTGLLTLLVAPDLPIEVEPRPDEPTALNGFDWTEFEPRVEP